MTNNVSKKIRLGIFITLGVIIFILAIYFVGERQQLFRTTFRLQGIFKDVAGLQTGNNVRFSGITVGVIENISIITDTTVKVDVTIDENARKFIKKDAVASIGSEGLMGNKVLIITAGTGGKKMIEDNDFIQTTQPVDMDQIMITFKTTMEHTADITGDLASIMSKIESGQGTIGRLIMDSEWRETFEATFVNLKDGSEGFKVIMDKADDLDQILASLNSTIKNTSDITSDLSDITTNINAGKGTLGRLLMDDSGASDLDSTLHNLKEGSAGLKMLIKKAKDSWLLWGF